MHPSSCACKARAVAALLCAAMLALVPSACGSSGSSAGDPAAAAAHVKHSSRAQLACTNATLGALQGVAKRIYGEVAEGRILAQALSRLRSSTTLVQAVESGEAKAATRVLRELQAGQVTRASVSRDGRTLATIGASDAVAPAKATLVNASGEAVGEVAVSIDTASEYAKTVLGITGMQVVARSGNDLLVSTLGPAALHIPQTGEFNYGGTLYHVASFAGMTFSERKATFSMLVPMQPLAPCHTAHIPTAAQAVADALGGVGENIYHGELSAEKVRAVVQEVEHTAAFRTAVEQNNPALAREQIITLFRSRLHVVRVRVETPHGVLVDVGGPYVLAPVRGAIRSGGHVIGHFQLSLQDDMGYMLLAHSFTGAQVLMRVGTTQVMSSLQPGPEQIPDRGPISYDGVSYQAFSFIARAFPEGRLRISLLFDLASPAA